MRLVLRLAGPDMEAGTEASRTMEAGTESSWT